MAKKNDPNYKQLCGHIPKELFLEFKKICLDRGVDQSQALEIAIKQWISTDENKNNDKD
ncbi:hypothetical protein [Crocosphaera sp.]|uniref:hypothetical protein n=1 Tax=Crocosphaera sp. TaxID=2729996 RepID=UPI00257EC393|nr:hypothetical protein [Crocosphaera sp.]NQZ65209.1 hypothetical protein [Crocosphaera sp.]